MGFVLSTSESGTFEIGYRRPPQTGVSDSSLNSIVSALRSLSALRCVITVAVTSFVPPHDRNNRH